MDGSRADLIDALQDGDPLLCEESSFCGRLHLQMMMQEEWVNSDLRFSSTQPPDFLQMIYPMHPPTQEDLPEIRNFIKFHSTQG